MKSNDEGQGKKESGNASEIAMSLVLFIGLTLIFNSIMRIMLSSRNINFFFHYTIIITVCGENATIDFYSGSPSSWNYRTSKLCLQRYRISVDVCFDCTRFASFSFWLGRVVDDVFVGFCGAFVHRIPHAVEMSFYYLNAIRSAYRI